MKTEANIAVIRILQRTRKYENSNLADVKLKDYWNNNQACTENELDLLAMHWKIFYHICLFLNAYHPIMNVDKY